MYEEYQVHVAGTTLSLFYRPIIQRKQYHGKKWAKLWLLADVHNPLDYIEKPWASCLSLKGARERGVFLTEGVSATRCFLPDQKILFLAEVIEFLNLEIQEISTRANF